MATAKRGLESIAIAGAPEIVYDLIADVSRMGEWSPECYRCDWLDDAKSAQVGARFRGHNRLGRVRWQTTSVLTAAERGREFAFTVVHDGTGREETTWRYCLSHPRAAGRCSLSPSSSCGVRWAIALSNCSSRAVARSIEACARRRSGSPPRPKPWHRSEMTAVLISCP